MKKFFSNVLFTFGMLLILAAAVGICYLMVEFSSYEKEQQYQDCYTAGRTSMEAADYAQAIAAFEDAYLLNATDEAALGLAEAWYASGDTEQAITVLANRLGLYASNATMEELLIQYKESIGIYENILVGGKEIPKNTTAIYLSDITLTEEDKQALCRFPEIVTLEMARCGLTDISFLKDFDKLMTLDLDGNPISDFTPLYNKPELRTLHIKDTAITDYEQLHPLTSLGFLDVNGSWITEAQMDALRAALPMTNVIGGAHFLIIPVTIAGETFNSDVTELDLSGRKIYDTNPLKDCSALLRLNLSDNSISWISGLDKLTTLNELNLNGNRLSNISALSGLSNLTKFYLNGNNVTDISVLASMPNLTELDLTGNPIYHGQEALAGLKQLQKLNLQDSLLKDAHLQYIPMDSMTELDLRNNNQLSQTAVTEFVAKYPNCTIYSDYS